MDESINITKQAWEEVSDESLLEALNNNRYSYNYEAQFIIVDEAENRGLIENAEANSLREVIRKIQQNVPIRKNLLITLLAKIKRNPKKAGELTPEELYDLFPESLDEDIIYNKKKPKPGN